MYENLKKEMTAKNISNDELAKLLGLHRNTVSNKLKGGDFSFDECMRIKEVLFPEYDAKWLFSKEKETKTA